MRILKMFAPLLLASAMFHVPALGQQPAPAVGKTDLTGLLEAAPVRSSQRGSRYGQGLRCQRHAFCQEAPRCRVRSILQTHSHGA